jgi:hypothetical protein
MAVGGVFLAANQGDAEALHTGLQTGDGCLEMVIVTKPPI